MEGEARKRLKHAKEVNEQEVIDGTTLEIVEKDETETNVVGSEEMELDIAHIFEKIKHFTQMVSELQESGNAMFKEMKNEFEERLISRVLNHIRCNLYCCSHGYLLQYFSVLLTNLFH